MDMFQPVVGGRVGGRPYPPHAFVHCGWVCREGHESTRSHGCPFAPSVASMAAPLSTATGGTGGEEMERLLSASSAVTDDPPFRDRRRKWDVGDDGVMSEDMDAFSLDGPRTHTAPTSSFCADVGVRALILLCDTDLEAACTAIVRKKGREEDRKGYLQYLVGRFLFPVFPACLCWALTIVGRVTSIGCTVLSSFTWYTVSFLLVVYTFLALGEPSQGRSWRDSGPTPIDSDREKPIFGISPVYAKLCVSLGCGIVALETLLSVLLDRTTVIWATANTVYGVVALLGLPLWFWARQRGVDVSPKLRYQPSTPIATLAFVTVFACFVATWLSYVQETYYWGLLTPLFVVHICAVIMDANKDLRYNFSYLVFYAIVMLHAPDFLGHSMMRYFDYLEDALGLATPERKQSLQVYKVVCSWVFLLLMTTYLLTLKYVVQRMATKYTSSRYLYVGQLYYYMFWYLLVVEEKPTDWTFWAMLMLQNLNYVLMNTGVYEDLNRWRQQCYAWCIVPCLHGKRKRGDGGEGATLPTDTVDNYPEELKDLQFRVQVAENDHLADTTALIVVTTTVVFWVLLGEKDVMVKQFQAHAEEREFNEEGGFGDAQFIEKHQKIAVGNLLLRFLFTFTCRLVSQRISHMIFSLKMHCLERQEKALARYRVPADHSPTRGRMKKRDSMATLQFGEGKPHTQTSPCVDGVEEGSLGSPPSMFQSPSRGSTVMTGSGVRIPRGAAAVIIEFEQSFWFFFLVTMSCAFSCLQRPGTPVRLAFCRDYGSRVVEAPAWPE